MPKPLPSAERDERSESREAPPFLQIEMPNPVPSAERDERSESREAPPLLQIEVPNPVPAPSETSEASLARRLLSYNLKCPTLYIT